MQFSLKRMLVLFACFNFLIAAAFTFPPIVSGLVFTFVALFVLPPFVIVGVVQTRGRQQAFFLGAMVTGTPHFIGSLYLLVVGVISFDFGIMFETGDGAWIYGAIHLSFIVMGTIGGLMGMAAHVLLVPKVVVADEKSKSESHGSIAESWSDIERISHDEAARPVKLPR